VEGVLLRVAGDLVSLATPGDVLALAADPADLGSLRVGDEVAGWREGGRLRLLRLARLRVEWGEATAAGGGAFRLRTPARTWHLAAPLPAAGWLRVCHDGVSALWAADAAGAVWLPPDTTRRATTSTPSTLSAVIVSIAERMAAWAAASTSGRKVP
jgi:hypothetical protein